MFKELIDKLKAKKKQLQNYRIENNTMETKTVEQNKSHITISVQNKISKIEINDYISMEDYEKIMKSSEEYQILELLCNCVLWNSNKQRVNKGTYYVIIVDNRIYNILFTGDKIKIDERTKIQLDEQTQKENITQERAITLNINKNEYRYYSAKHDKTGNTFYIKYYNKNRLYSLGTLDLNKEEAYEEINSVIHNLENIEGIKNILNIPFLKTNNLMKILECYQNQVKL